MFKALSEKGDRFRTGIIVGKEDRYKYIDERVWQDAKSVVCQKMSFEVIRYYVLPTEYILMISGEPGQFLIFWGQTIPEKGGAALLAALDWNGAVIDGDVAIVD